MSGPDYSQFTLLDLFRLEAESHGQALTAGLLDLERDPTAAPVLDACMRAAHSLKGAARIIDLMPGVELAHAMEECFVAGQVGRLVLQRPQIDLLLRGVDLMLAVARKATDPPTPDPDTDAEVAAFLVALDRALSSPVPAEPVAAAPVPRAATAEAEIGDRMLRITAESLNRLLGLAGESLMEAGRLRPFGDELLRLRRLQFQAARALERLRDVLDTDDDRQQLALADSQARLADCQHALTERLTEFDSFARRGSSLAHRLHEEALASRMRPFEDGVRRYARSVRDLGHDLGKEVRLEIAGGGTRVDRDILEQLDAPFGHLLRNAIDHGIEPPEERLAAGKPAQGLVRLEARHHAGMLHISIADDGRGIPLELVRQAVQARGLANAEVAAKLSEAELLEFLFLPGFTMKTEVTEISGRGVGLDAVQAMVRQVRGTIRVDSRLGEGARFRLQLPLTLSVVRTLLVEIGGEPYAFPLAGIERALRLPRAAIGTLEGRQHFAFEGRNIGLVDARQLLESEGAAPGEDNVPVVIIGDPHNSYGLAVGRLLGERDLVVQPLDAVLGKVAGVSAAALMQNGAPVLILDVEDLIRGLEKLAASGGLGRLGAAHHATTRRRRVLVVDDSLTIRELERKLLTQKGYEVEVAVDGMDGWNAARAGSFDLIVTDVDMPRMDGIELVTLVRRDPRLGGTPIMIVSYKDREEDRVRGLEAGADYYLTKGSFHDAALVQAVADLIGEATA